LEGRCRDYGIKGGYGLALIMAVSTNYGIDIPESYVRIDEQSGGKELISLRVRWYFSQDKCEEGCLWLQEEIFTFEPSVIEGADNFIKQGYEHLKTLPDFSIAVDV
jgi:hypothetical protein